MRFFRSRPSRVTASLQHVEDFVGGGGFPKFGEDDADPVAVRLNVGVGDGVGGENDVVAVVGGRARGRFDA